MVPEEIYQQEEDLNEYQKTQPYQELDHSREI